MPVVRDHVALAGADAADDDTQAAICTSIPAVLCAEVERARGVGSYEVALDHGRAAC